MHYVIVDPLVDGAFAVKCSCGSLNKKCESSNTARRCGYMHLAGLNIDLFELASAGKADHV